MQDDDTKKDDDTKDLNECAVEATDPDDNDLDDNDPDDDALPDTSFLDDSGKDSGKTVEERLNELRLKFLQFGPIPAPDDDEADVELDEAILNALPADFREFYNATFPDVWKMVRRVWPHPRQVPDQVEQVYYLALDGYDKVLREEQRAWVLDLCKRYTTRQLDSMNPIRKLLIRAFLGPQALAGGPPPGAEEDQPPEVIERKARIVWHNLVDRLLEDVLFPPQFPEELTEEELAEEELAEEEPTEE